MSQAIQALPFQITQAGDYHLAASLHLPQGEYALKIAAHGVKLDLGGHTLSIDGGTTVLLAAAEIQISNGVLQGAPTALAPEPHRRADRCHFSRLEVTGGLFVGGDDVQVERCRVQGGSFGIRAGQQAQIEGCEVTGALVGIEVGAGSRVVNCRVSECEDGVYAFGTRQAPSHLEKLLVYECRGLGIRLDGPGELYLCEAHNNGSDNEGVGIMAGPASVVRECEAYGNKGGDITIVDPCELHKNRSSDGSGQR